MLQLVVDLSFGKKVYKNNERKVSLFHTKYLYEKVFMNKKKFLLPLNSANNFVGNSVVYRIVCILF